MPTHQQEILAKIRASPDGLLHRLPGGMWTAKVFGLSHLPSNWHTTHREVQDLTRGGYLELTPDYNTPMHSRARRLTPKTKAMLAERDKDAS